MNPSHRLARLRPWILVPSCLLMTAALSSAQVAPASPAAAESDPKKTIPVQTVSAPLGEVVELSPFEVVSDAKGYYAANTMSGTRFNSKLEDLASSITVVTKEQMTDFAMLDINDIFLYTAGTEGTGTFTDFTVDRNGSVSENVSLNPTQANRVRGIGAANISLGNVETQGRTPVDSLLVDSVEVSRGPNANVFGLGNPSGTVNQVLASGNLSRNFTQLQIRGDSYDGYRESLDMNRVLVKNKLAFRFSQVAQHDGYVRKPSGQNIVRYNGMLKFQPFKRTNINASYLFYRSNGNRPNYSPPRDNISYWISQGRPTWDPVGQVIHVNGTTIGNGGVGTTTPITGALAAPLDYFNNSFTGSGRFYAWISANGIEMAGAGAATQSTNPGSGATAVAGNAGNTARYMATSAGTGIVSGKPGTQPLFTTTPSIKDKSLYDWEDINLASINRFLDKSLTSTVTIDQNVFDTPRQRLDAQVSFMREDSKRYARVTVGELNSNGQSGQLQIDVNERLLDGSPNPFFLRPFLGVDQPFTTETPSRWDTYRAQMSYRLDLTHEKGLMRWLGLHQFSAYDEYKYRVNRSYGYKDGITDAHSWLAAGVPRVNQGAISGGSAAAGNITRGYWRYYLGDATGNNVDYAPNDFKYGTYNFRYGNSNTGFVSEPVAIARAATTDRTGGSSNSLTIIKSAGAILQSHFWDDRIVTTFGRRQDRQLVRNGSTPQKLNPDGISFDYSTIDHWAPNYRSNRFGKTDQSGVVVKPFRGWQQINSMSESAGATGFFGQVLRGLSLTYNKSNSFTPQDPRFSLSFNELPNPSGEGKDYGFALNLMDNRLVVRFNKWETTQVNARNGDAGTIAQRVTRIDITSTAAFLLQTQALNWVAQDPAHANWTTAQVQAEVGKQMGVSWEDQTRMIDLFNSGLISSTNDITAKGTELEINYNPTNYWRVAASGTETQSLNTNVSQDVNKWLAQRLPVWTAIQDPRGIDHVWGTADDRNVPWWTTSYGGSQTAAQNYASFVESPFAVIKQKEGTANPQIRRYNFKVSTNFNLRGITEHKILRNVDVGGAIRWEDKGAIGYFGNKDAAGIYTTLNAKAPIYDSAHTYVDLNLGYKTKLWASKVGSSFRLTCRNLQESGHLQAIAAYPDGTPNTYRIVDPRQFILTATFDL